MNLKVVCKEGSNGSRPERIGVEVQYPAVTEDHPFHDNALWTIESPSFQETQIQSPAHVQYTNQLQFITISVNLLPSLEVLDDKFLSEVEKVSVHT